MIELTSPSAADTITPADPCDLGVGLPGLEAACRARGWSLAKAAVELGEYPAAVYGWARGRMSPTSRVVVRLARKLGVTADVLLGLAPPASRQV